MSDGKDTRKGLSFLRVRKILSRDLVIFLTFLIIAFILWYLNSLRKETETTVKLQLKYINPPSGLTVLNNSSSEILIDISGQGYSIVKFCMQKKNRQLTINLSSAILIKRTSCKSESEFCLIAGTVLDGFLKQMPSELKVLQARPDTLLLFLTENPSSDKAERKDQIQ